MYPAVCVLVLVMILVMLFVLCRTSAGSSAQPQTGVLEQFLKQKSGSSPSPAPSGSSTPAYELMSLPKGALVLFGEQRLFLRAEEGARLSIGRDPSCCSLEIPDPERYVARHQLDLFFEHGRLQLQQVSGTSGSFLFFSGKKVCQLERNTLEELTDPVKPVQLYLSSDQPHEAKIVTILLI